jgi:hypothetical protein
MILPFALPQIVDDKFVSGVVIQSGNQLFGV